MVEVAGRVCPVDRVVAAILTLVPMEDLVGDRVAVAVAERIARGKVEGTRVFVPSSQEKRFCVRLANKNKLMELYSTRYDNAVENRCI